MLRKIGKTSRFVDGLRYTDEETMDIVQMVLCGKINKNICSLLGSMGVKAVGLCGKDSSLIGVRKKPPVDGVDYGYVGEITSVNADMIEDLCLEDYVPVIASIGTDANGASYNINADTAAGEVGAAIGAHKLIYLTDIDGIRRDPADPSTLMPEVRLSEVERMIENGTISGGMIPKVRSCVNAVKRGIKHVNIVCGTIPHSILVELFTDRGIGTLIRE